MPNQYSNRNRHRDEQGRFTDEDDRYSRSGRGSQRYRDDYDDDNRGHYSQQRDNQGRFAGDDGRKYSYDRDYGRSQTRSRDERGRFDNENDQSNERDQYSRKSRYAGPYPNDDYSDQGRGWFGDSEGHSRAAREGWDERDNRMTSRNRDDRFYGEDDRGYNQNRNYDEEITPIRAQYGDWGAEDNRGSRRSSSSYGTRSSRNRNDDYDDENQRSSDQGRGWHGDPEGHAEAGSHSHDNDRSRTHAGRRKSAAASSPSSSTKSKLSKTTPSKAKASVKRSTKKS